MAEEKPQRLGRGLAALMGDFQETQPERIRGTRRVALTLIHPNPRNPRKHFDDEPMQELTNSVRERGVIQPLVVRSLGGIPENFDLIAGERRYQAAYRAGLTEVPIHVIDVTDREAMELALIENIQRVDLTFVEEAMGYEALIHQFGYSVTELAGIVGKSRPHVSNQMRMLSLPEKVKVYVLSGKLSPSHARAALSTDDPLKAAEEMIERGLNVRQAEAVTAEQMNRVGQAVRKRLEKAEKDPDLKIVEQGLTAHLGLAVVIDMRGQGGELRVKYKNLEQLEGLVQLLKN